MGKIEINATNSFNLVLSQIINSQKQEGQPIYVIASFWCGYFNGIVKFSTEGDKDLEELKDYFKKNCAWGNNEIGVTEQTYRLIKIDFSQILDWKGE